VNFVLFRLLFCLIPATGLAQTAGAACRQALALGLDVSWSVDQREYALQLGGLAAAMLDEDVQSTLLGMPSAPVALAIYEWSGRANQALILDWTKITTPGDIAHIAALLRVREPPDGVRTTAIGRAITYGGDLLARAPECWKYTLDISGDGRNNDGHRPKNAKTHPMFRTAIINGLVIGAAEPSAIKGVDKEIGRLQNYYRQEVIHGPGAFIETAVGFRDFEKAMRRKLLRELTLAVAAADPPKFLKDGI